MTVYPSAEIPWLQPYGTDESAMTWGKSWFMFAVMLPNSQVDPREQGSPPLPADDFPVVSSQISEEGCRSPSTNPDRTTPDGTGGKYECSFVCLSALLMCSACTAADQVSKYMVRPLRASG